MKPFHGITQEAMVDFLTTATNNPLDNLTTYERNVYAAEAQAVLRLLHMQECELRVKQQNHLFFDEDLHELARKSARKYAESLRKRMP